MDALVTSLMSFTATSNHITSQGPLASQLIQRRFEEDRVRESVLQTHLANLPKNTKLQYGRKMQEFIQWCREAGDEPTVYESKLAAFLQQKVVGRKVKKGKRTLPCSVGVSTINAYVSAVTKLWSIQVIILFYII
jgi:hypothetical protein